MEVREYLSVRRAYNLVRQGVSARERLAFEELAILAKLDATEAPLRTSDIAEYQGVLRPTMTHRTNHLCDYGLIERERGEQDRRNVCCSISDRGREVLIDLATRVVDNIPAGMSLNRISCERALKYFEAMGSVFLTAADLVILCIDMQDGPCGVSQLVRELGLLQPTASMSVSALVDRGLLERAQAAPGSGHAVSLTLTEAGKARADEVRELIEGIVVRRRRRGSAAQ